MSHPLDAFVTNQIFEQNYFENDVPKLLPALEDSSPVFAQVKAIYAAQNIMALNESQLEDFVIKPTLQLLGWFPLYQEIKVVHGKQMKPDWTLFPSSSALGAYIELGKEERKTALGDIIAFCESKDAKKALDTKKADKDNNPYLQLLEYLSYTRLEYGMLSNAVEWWLVDNTKVTSEKRYLRIDLAAIIKADDVEAFRYFLHFFRRANFVADEAEKPAPIKVMAWQEAQARRAVEEDLRKVIYGLDGEDSLFERIGRALFAATGKTASPSNLRLVFENSLYLVFRLLFIAFFEDKFAKQLDSHPSYPDLSLRKLYNGLGTNPAAPHRGWNNLKTLFATLNDGNADLGIPLLNGGLFDNRRATLLTKPQVMDDALLKAILRDLFCWQGGLLRRDFRTLSVTHLGAIYEGLLEFEFRVAEEELSYIIYRIKEKGVWKSQEGFFDTYDAANLRADKFCEIHDERRLPQGELYLVSSQNSRKAAGSYYTPSELSFPLVRQAIDHQLGKLDSILKLRILDNACGSGHLLIEALSYITRKALDHMGEDEALAAQLATEKAKIETALAALRITVEIDEFAVLKRLLLKQVIYGVDMQPFAIELAHLSLWIDTFVFGTPLSFIEHHVKVGNALIGATIADFDFYISGYKDQLFKYALKEEFTKLRDVFAKLSAIRDTTPEEVNRSKALYKNEIVPMLQRLDDALNLVNLRKMLHHEGKTREAELLSKTGELARKLFDQKDTALALRIQTYKDTYHFFNWELEFPEVFASGEGQGFHVIVGNPPWDKTKFLDPDFFSQYRSNYRSMTNSQKAQVQADLLDKPHIRKQYDEDKDWVQAVNEYYKAAYVLNAGSGDGNLFRFFVERNLGLLLPGGTLNYILPTGLLTDEGSDTLRKHILERYRINSFDGFENRELLFPDVDVRYKFGLLQIERTHPDADHASKMRFMLTDPRVLDTEEGRFDYSVQDVRATSPGHMAFMEVGGGRADLDLLRRFYGLFKPLSPDWLDFRTELHATNDKKIFRERRRPEDLPLYKGASVWQYDSLYAEPEYWLNPEVFDDYLRGKEISRLIADIYPALPLPKLANQKLAILDAVGVADREDLGQFVKPDRGYFRLGFRDIARDTDERTLITALVPQAVGAQNTLWVSIPKYYRFEGKQKVSVSEVSVERLLFAQAVFNSLVVDWILRFSVSIHVNKTYLMRLPLPQPTDSELTDTAVYKELVRNSLRLTLHYNRDGFAELGARFGIEEKDIPDTPKKVDMLRIRNDCLVAGLYHVTPEELAYLLKSFKVMHSKRPEYGQSLKEKYVSYCAVGGLALPAPPEPLHPVPPPCAA
ncbi:MAG: N-6 DNA methylase [Humidesulfovibrio sp.]|uniref:Eco57I restriction-modification methylase domain-containing protein n=1 Tax=Humidesulfovibrio sp. TaxID=2910988 RepID=UPI0027F7A91B|nr:N-6 DNA methylase [Humidesulfovibrio sp.]MDQ7836052.1 N-6 DNA methylase [Humidesulfovibrio sp.]